MNRSQMVLRCERLDDRLTPSGGLDPAFGVEGKVLVNINTTEAATAVVVQPNGQAVVAGWTSSTTKDFVVLRFQTNGTLDTGFGTQGMAIIDFGGDDVANAVALQRDGSIIVVGTTSLGAGDVAVARLTRSGTLDPTFGDEGKKTFGYVPGRTSPDTGTAVAVDYNGHIFITGSSLTGGLATDQDFGIAVLGNTGLFEPAFSGDGRITIAFDLGGTGQDLATSVALERPDRLLVAGSAATPTGTDFAVVRIMRNGLLDTTFDGDGRQTVDFGGEDRVTGLAWGFYDSVTMVGSGSVAGLYCVARLTEAGNLDATFDGDGKRTLSGWTAPGTGATAMVLQPDGRTVIAGTAGTTGARDWSVLRLNRDGSTDTQFGQAFLPTIVDFGGDDTPTGIALQPDGNVVLVGTAQGAGIALTRHLAHPGVLVETFSSGTTIGTWRWTTDDGWRRLAAEPVAVHHIARDGSVYLTESDTGFWKIDPAGVATNLSPSTSVDWFETSASGIAYGQFSGSIWRFRPDQGWSLVSTESAQQPTIAETGMLYVVRPAGVWSYGPIQGGIHLTAATPYQIATSPTGVLYGSFAHGVFKFENRDWTLLSGYAGPAIRLQVTTTGQLIGDFDNQGIWWWSPERNLWTGYTGANAEQMYVDSLGNLFAQFVPSGTSAVRELWRRDVVTGVWTQLYVGILQPWDHAVSIDGRFFGNFQGTSTTSEAIWMYVPGVGWSRLSAYLADSIHSQFQY